MIKIIGIDTGAEAEAALALKSAAERAWPWLCDDPHSFVQIIPNAQCYGESPRDLDIVLLALLDPARAQFQPAVDLFLLNGTRVESTQVQVRSFCICIEVKDHRPRQVRFEGNKVEVRYSGMGGRSHWHSATQQSEKQKYSLLNYLKKQMPGVSMPYVCNLIWLRNIPREELPRSTSNLLPATFTWSGLLNAVASNQCVWTQDGTTTLSAVSRDSDGVLARASEILGRRIEPTALDRQRMDRIANGAISDSWMSEVGQQQVVFHGRGGTGKTAILLSLAWRLWETRSARVLLLTYNRALVADLRRLLTLMGMTDDVGQPLVEVKTVHSFLFRVLSALGVVDHDENDFFETYEQHKDDALALLRDGAITTSDLETMVAEDRETLDWDFVFIDEAQDWPENERDLLHRLYKPERFVIADGRDQLVRRDSACDWARGDEATESLRVPLARGLRMKANLASFANMFAAELRLPSWNIERNPEAGGGQVIVVEGDYRAARVIHQRVVDSARAAGNCPVDLLMCVPPSMVHDESEGRRSIARELLDTWGAECWDGVDDDLRREFPTSVEQLRVVQYDSCRGLEGWSVVALGLDDFYEYKLSTSPAPAEGTQASDVDLRMRFASRWLMIPVTRAIDCLVLNVHSRSSFVGSALRQVAERCPDVVEWHEL